MLVTSLPCSIYSTNISSCCGIGAIRLGKIHVAQTSFYWISRYFWLFSIPLVYSSAYLFLARNNGNHLYSCYSTDYSQADELPITLFYRHHSLSSTGRTGWPRILFYKQGVFSKSRFWRGFYWTRAVWRESLRYKHKSCEGCGSKWEGLHSGHRDGGMIWIPKWNSCCGFPPNVTHQLLLKAIIR